MAPGPMFSTSTSAVLMSASNIARPRGVLRLSVTPFLFELRSRKNQASSPRLSESAVRPASPAGGSTLMTSAPSQASICVHDGPASYWVRSTTRIPASAFGILASLWVLPTLLAFPPAARSVAPEVRGDGVAIGTARVVVIHLRIGLHDRVPRTHVRHGPSRWRATIYGGTTPRA